MRVLGHIHSLNDEEVIDRSLGALLDQTFPLEEILLVDNGSTDGTLHRKFPPKVTVIRHPQNVGTSGAVVTGFRYALEKNFDWIWVLDADSAPKRDALQKLLELYEHFPHDLQAQVRVLASLPIEATTHEPIHSAVFTANGPRQVQPDKTQPFYECDITIFSGSLFKLQAVQKIGLPDSNYVLDCGECEYAYRGKQCGYRTFTHQESIIEHNIGAITGPPTLIFRIGPKTFQMPDLPPIRLYYLYRNTTYFWLHVYHRGNVARFIRQSSWIPTHLLGLLGTPRRRSRLPVCLRGLWDGLFKKLHRRF